MEIGGYLSIIYRQRQNYIKEQLMNYEIGLTDYPLILILNQSEGLSCNEISKNYFINKSLVSKSSSKLIKLGYLKQQKDLNHKQKINLYLTLEGKRLVPEIKKISKSWEEEMMADLDEKEKKLFIKIFKGVYERSLEYLDK